MTKQESIFLGVIGSVLMAVLFLGCSLGPSDGQVKDDLQKWFDGRWPGTILVSEYEVMNKERDGWKYLITYRAKAHFIKDADGCIPTCCGDVCLDKQVAGFRWIRKTSDNPHVVQKGDIFETRGTNIYTRTRGGWSCESR